MLRATRTYGRSTLGTAALLLACGLSAAAGPAGTRANATASGAASRILGTAWKADNTPLPHARLRLRNVTTGRVDATTEGDAAGQFTVTNVESGVYLVELVSERGKVLAVSAVFSLAPGETVATFVRLSARAPSFSGFFSNAAAAAVTAASGLGVTALGSDGQPVSAAAGSGR